MSTTEAEESTTHHKGEGARRLTKNEKRRMKKKQPAPATPTPTPKPVESSEAPSPTAETDREEESEIEIEYVAADVDLELAGLDQRILEQLRGVFHKFAKPEELVKPIPPVVHDSALVPSEESKTSAEEEAQQASEAAVAKKLSKKKKKLLNRLSVAELKQLVDRPDVVEAHDVSSSDPRLLVYLKALRNSVPVPRHWNHIRRYLQSKRGSDKIPYQLPEFIADTGIAKIREAIMEQEEMKKGKQKARERVRPKMGKIDIDYQVLHDAFFKYQTKPKMTIHGDIYYEGREFEVHMKEKTPGVLSAELMAALGMTENTPPPWLVNMQRYGPPPSYPNLRIPGLNAPLPPGASYGFHPGGWGKPPVDEYGRPLYGDVFGLVVSTETEQRGEEVDKDFRWGAIEYEEEEEAEEEEEEEEEEEVEQTKSEKKSRFDKSGLETPASIDGASLMSGLETPDTIDLRKREGYETPDVLSNRELYHVIAEKKASVSGQLFGSDRQYVLPGKGDVQLSINPDELEELMNNKDKLKDAHEAHSLSSQSELMFGKIPASYSKEGTETEEKGKKRKAEAPLVYKKAKEFKF